MDSMLTQSPFGGGGGFSADPFLEVSGGLTTPAVQKSTKTETICLSNGDLAGAIIATLIMSAFIGFLTWLIYLRPKFLELKYRQSHDNRKIQHHHHHPVSSSSSISNHKLSSRKQQIDDDGNTPQLPLDVTDYKFGTFPFRQSQTSSVNGHYNRTDWLNRLSSSFRSVNMEQDTEMIDVELLDPTFGGLNFSITGNMRAGIFVKEILDKGNSHKNSKTTQLKTGDRIMALTVCFDSIVYEDALTILSYASPYPVILRIQRQINPTKVNVTSEKRSTTTNSTNKVKWRDDFELYDNDTPVSRSLVHTNHLPPIPSNTKTPASPSQNRSSAKKSTHTNNKSSTNTKGNKIKTSTTTTKRPNNNNVNVKKSRSKTNNNNQIIVASTGLTSKPPISTNTKTVKSVTDAVISYLHYKGNTGVEHSKDKAINPETTMVPYYDSPYDYYYGGHMSQYQYLHQSQLNKNNNNSLSTESLTAVTPNLSTSVYTIQFSSIKSSYPIAARRCQRRLSLPQTLPDEENEHSLNNNHDNIDTFV